MRTLSHTIALSFLATAAWLSASIAPGDPEWPDAYPEWWYNADEPANGLIDATQPVLNEHNDTTLAIGQLKHIVSESRDELDSVLAPVGGAGSEIDALVDSFTTITPENLSPANVGQLKNVSSKFFDRFAEVGFTPEDTGWPNSLILNQGAIDNSPLYPWLNDVTAENASLASIGQAKHLFSWQVRDYVALDSDSDELPDFIEQLIIDSDPDDEIASLEDILPNSDFDDDTIGIWDELLQGSDPFANTDLNENSLPDDWELFWNDQFAVFPKPITASLTHQESITKQLYLNNPVSPDANFTVTVSDNLAGNEVVYTYEDSLTGGAMYNWTEISATGTLLSEVSNADDDFEGITLTQFSFPFYGVNHTEIFVSSNGLITLESGSSSYNNRSIPSTSSPNNFIAPFWLDQNASDAGKIYYLEEADRLIIQFDGISEYVGSGRFTYQAVLYNNGIIEFLYKDMSASASIISAATVGVENGDGTDGLEIAYDTDYIQSGLAVQVSKNIVTTYFVDVFPLNGNTPTESTTALEVTFNTFDLAPGIYTANIDISHTGTGTTPLNVPVILKITNPPAIISITSPEDGDTIFSDESININVSATDEDFGIERVEFFYDETKIGEDLTSSYSYNWSDPIIGSHTLTARAIDQFGAITISDPVTVNVMEDIDGDLLGDAWEIQYFGSLSEDALGDYDGDGAVNQLEYDRGSDPSDAQDVPTNLPSIVEITSPPEGFYEFEGFRISAYVTVSDPDTELDRVEFYYDSTLIGSDTSVKSNFATQVWDPPVGMHNLIARAIDIYDDATDSEAVVVTILGDSDRDHMEDTWEQLQFGSLDEEASADFDGDGIPNIFEYNHGTDPTDAQNKLIFAETEMDDFNYFIVDGSLVEETEFRKKTILAAIENANDYDVIEVRPATYNEVLGTLDDRLYVFGSEGARKTIIDTKGLDTRALYLESESVFSGLTFQGANPEYASFNGGAIYLDVSGNQNKPRFIGCRFIDNKVGNWGGAVYVKTGDLVLVSCTIADNFGSNGNAIYNGDINNNIRLVNTLLWNPGSSVEIAGFTSRVVFDHSLTRDDITGNVLIDKVDQMTSDPGLDFDHSLFASSIARDAGTLSLYANLDLDGEAVADGLKDIGADEFTDTDNDGFPDWIEILAGGNLAVDDDYDSDSLMNLDDYNAGANPLSADTDSDGILDGDELYGDGTRGDTDGYVTRVNNPDTDDDGLEDGWEVGYGFNPVIANSHEADSDLDGVTDLQEFSLGSNPLVSDTDGDEMPDLYEYSNGLDLVHDDSELDEDSDGLSNLSEYQAGTQANNVDSDSDLFSDGWEIAYGFDPLVADSIDTDPDGDGINTLTEYQYGTNPLQLDTDGDGTSDDIEINQGSNATNPNDDGQTPPEDNLQEVSFYVGSYVLNRWEMIIEGLGPDMRQMRFSNQIFGEIEYKSFMLWKDSSYRISLRYLGNSYGPPSVLFPTATPYGYEADVERGYGLLNSSFQWGPDQIWILDNSDGLLSHGYSHDENIENIAEGKEAFLLPISIKEVSFDGTNYHEIDKDDISVTYEAPHWIDKDDDRNPSDTINGERNYPVAYTRNTKPSIGAKLRIKDLRNSLSIKLRAKGSDGIEIPETVPQINGDEIVLPITESITNWSNTVKFYDLINANKAFTLDWQMSIVDSRPDASGVWFTIASTNHQVYLTLNDPVTSLRQETLFEISCRNADGIDQTSEMTEAIWSEFTDRVVKRVDGHQLTYYNNYTCGVTNTTGLLANGDGQCGSWANFFIDLRKIHGIDDPNEYVLFKFKGINGLNPDLFGFVVKNWSFSGSGTSGSVDFPYLNIPNNNLVGASSYNWDFSEVNDQSGIPGQGNPNPASLFNNHQVVISGEYYDPSYGIKHGSLADIDDNAIDGYYFIFPPVPIDESNLNVDFNGDGDKTDYYNGWPVDEPTVNLDVNGDGDKLDTNLGYPGVVYLFMKNSSGLDLIEQRFDF